MTMQRGLVNVIKRRTKLQ